ncbi:transposase [Gracilimonas halophila]|uniref:Transposase n=1 Tax=Gracilimonas halophila TaxID=1834464 RepID=A0ABW5JII4_9BACT
MQFYPGHTYHLYNQGNNRQQLFFESENYLYFLKKVRKGLLPYCNIIAWCLMPNHFHFLIQVHEDYTHQNAINNKEKIVNPLNRKIGSIQSSYTKAINNRYNRTGSLFRQRTKAKILSDKSKSRVDTAVNCFFYIHQNPLKAGLVESLEGWEFSSFKDYAGIRNGDLCNIDLGKDLFNLPNNARDFYELSYRTIPDQVIKKFY